MAGELRRTQVTFIRKGPTMPMHPRPISSGVFKPVDHVLTPSLTAAHFDAGVNSLRDAGCGESDISRYTPGDMRDQLPIARDPGLRKRR